MYNRFKDKNLVLHDFMNEMHVKCPECNQRAIAKNNIETYKSVISCTNCSYRSSSDNKVIEFRIRANCNNCGEMIKFYQRSNEKKEFINIRCHSCQSTHKFEPKITEWKSFQVILDKYGLWYSDSFKGDHFWAYNNEHLEYIERYVMAGLRQRHNRMYVTLVERLPKFVKSKKNRKSLLKLIDKMKQK